MDELKPEEQIRNVMLALAETRRHTNYRELCLRLGKDAQEDNYTRQKWNEFNELARAFSPFTVHTLTRLLEKYWPEESEKKE